LLEIGAIRSVETNWWIVVDEYGLRWNSWIEDGEVLFLEYGSLSETLRYSPGDGVEVPGTMWYAEHFFGSENKLASRCLFGERTISSCRSCWLCFPCFPQWRQTENLKDEIILQLTRAVFARRLDASCLGGRGGGAVSLICFWAEH
jgi:hypothetical protein